MTSRDRLQAALNHKATDRPPVDLGATAVTGIAAAALYRLRAAIGLGDRPVRVHEPFQILGMVEDADRTALGIDVAGIFGPGNFFGYETKGWKPWMAPGPTPVLVGSGFEVTVDEKGDTLIYPKGDRTLPPSGRLPKGGWYFDGIVRQEPVDEDRLDGRADFAEQFKVLEAGDIEHYRVQAERLYRETDCGLILNFGGAGLGDVAFLPGTALARTPGIRSVEDWYMAHVLHPEYIHDVYSMQEAASIQSLALLWEAVGSRAEAVFVSGTDFGTQRSEFMSPDMFREFYRPHFERINRWIHDHTTWKTFYHSCGSIRNLLDDFVGMGVDILNPVQCSATGMEPAALKAKYGDRLVFWGGVADTQKTLPFGTPEEVEAEVRERIRILGAGGGYVANPIHNVQGPTPVENLLAMFRGFGIRVEAG